jgi:hypothetical protein
MSKTYLVAAEHINIDDEVDIDSIDWEQEARDAERLFSDWTSVEVEVLPCAHPAPIPVPATVASRYFLRSTVKVSTPHDQTHCLRLSTDSHP